ncbi:MAG: glycosyltransferase [Prolixibacteraceae bacterium]|nr:glycosyltransferase [Prolixibacteraceae bacterium]
MLSICIPVYNFDVRELTNQLCGQASLMNADVEILIYDDDSAPLYKQLNEQIANCKNVKYKALAQNIGRSAIRNLLADEAAGTHILFVDADSLPEDENFLKRYLESADHPVVCGGTMYEKTPPDNLSAMLRWVYGRKREQLTASVRSKKIFSITSNNFMIQREVVVRYPFRESIREYGHEDTVLGFDLVSAGIAIRHIDNFVIHIGLESSAQYLEKTRTSIKNLLHISHVVVTSPDFSGGYGLLKMKNKLEKLKLSRIAGWLFKKNVRRLEQNLTGANPKLWIFDLYRIGFMCSLE